MLYPRPSLIARLSPQTALPNLPLGRYQTQLTEIISSKRPIGATIDRPKPIVDWRPSDQSRNAGTVFVPAPET